MFNKLQTHFCNQLNIQFPGHRVMRFSMLEKDEQQIAAESSDLTHYQHQIEEGVGYKECGSKYRIKEQLLHQANKQPEQQMKVLQWQFCELETEGRLPGEPGPGQQQRLTQCKGDIPAHHVAGCQCGNHVFHASWVVDDFGLQARVATGDSPLEIILGQQSCFGTGETEEEEQASERVLLPPRVASRT